MAICVSGPAGCGKSTLLEDVATYFAVDDFKVSRAIQAKYGKTLYEIVGDVELCHKFQLDVLKAKFENDSKLAKFVLVERGFSDVFAFYEMWLDEFLSNDSISEELYEKRKAEFLAACLAAQTACYSKTVLLPAVEAIMQISSNEQDPHRAAPIHANIFDRLMAFLQQVDNHQIYIMQTEGRQDRVNELLKELNK